MLSGDVQLKYQDLDLKADEAGDRSRDQERHRHGQRHPRPGAAAAGGRLADLQPRDQDRHDPHATGQVAPDYYFARRRGRQDRARHLRDQERRLHLLQPAGARLELPGQGGARSRSTATPTRTTPRCGSKKLPVLYTPYILWPVQTERSSGFLIPNIGYSELRGAELGLAYFQTLGRSYDTTFHLDTYTQELPGARRRVPLRADGRGPRAISSATRSTTPRPGRGAGSSQLNHTTDDLPHGMRAVVHYQNYSDFNFFRTSSATSTRNTLRFIDSRAFVTGNWGPNLVNLLLDSRETFIDPAGRHAHPAPAARAPVPPALDPDRQDAVLSRGRQLGSTTSTSTGRSSYPGQYGRFDLFPQVTLPVRRSPGSTSR